MKTSALRICLIILILIICLPNVTSAQRALTFDPKNINPRVIELQKILNSFGYNLKEDGKYGQMTAKVVKDLQCEYGVICSGTEKTTGFGSVGPKTWALINSLKSKNKGTSPLSLTPARQVIIPGFDGNNLELQEQSYAPSSGSNTLRSTGLCTSASLGDLATNMRNQIDSRISGLTADTKTKSLWLSRSATIDGTWVRNPDVWTSRGSNPLDFTGVSPFKIDTISPNIHSYQQAGTLISPRHAIFASHYDMPIGAKVVFVAQDGTPHVRTVTNSKKITGPSMIDISVALLDSDLPSSIAYYPVLDVSTFKEKLYRVSNVNPEFPVLTLNQDDTPLVQGFRSFFGLGINSPESNTSQIYYSFNNYNGINAHDPAVVNLNPTQDRINFSGYLRIGDSGDATFAVIDGKLALLGVHTGTNGGSLISGYANQINSAMNELGGGYQLTFFNTDCFTSYRLNYAPNFNTRSGVYSDAELEEDEKQVGYFSVPEGLFIDDNTKPFFQFPLIDRDGDRLTITVENDFANLLVVDQTKNTVSFRNRAQYYGRTPPGGIGSDLYRFAIRLTDNGNPPATNIYPSSIKVVPSVMPLFDTSLQRFNVPENSDVGTVVGKITATPKDPGDRIIYSISDHQDNRYKNAFSINPDTGVITVRDKNALDFETNQAFKLHVTAQTVLSPTRSVSTILRDQRNTALSSALISVTNIIDESGSAQTVVPGTDPLSDISSRLIDTTLGNITQNKDAGLWITTVNINWQANYTPANLYAYVYDPSGQVKASRVLITRSSGSLAINITDLNQSGLYSMRVCEEGSRQVCSQSKNFNLTIPVEPAPQPSSVTPVAPVAPATPYATIKFPTAGTTLTRGNSYTITWDTNLPSSQGLDVYIVRLSGQEKLGTVSGSGNSFVWNISAITPAENSLRIKLMNPNDPANATLAQSSYFSIIRPVNETLLNKSETDWRRNTASVIESLTSDILITTKDVLGGIIMGGIRVPFR